MDDSIKKLKTVYEMLEDEESRFTYVNRLNYLLTGEFSYIDNIVTTYLPELPSLVRNKTIEEMVPGLPNDRKIVLFGAGIVGAMLLPIFCKDKRFFGFCSSTVKKQKTGFHGYPVISPENLLASKDASVVVSVIDSKAEILQILREAEYPEELIFTVNGLKMSENNQYFGPDFIKFEQEEVFVDAGSFHFETALALRESCKQVKKIYAFEPNEVNYHICQTNQEKYQFTEAKLFQAGTWSKAGTLHFNANAVNPAGSCVTESGEISIPVKAIDEVVDPKERVTFIKMDVEGAELESLKGAQHTIQRDKPKLAICIYHKPEDMTEIPLYIKSLVPEYKLYLRHHSNYIYETVLYAVMP